MTPCSGAAQQPAGDIALAVQQRPREPHKRPSQAAPIDRQRASREFGRRITRREECGHGQVLGRQPLASPIEPGLLVLRGLFSGRRTLCSVRGRDRGAGRGLPPDGSGCPQRGSPARAADHRGAPPGRPPQPAERRPDRLEGMDDVACEGRAVDPPVG